MNDIKLYKCNDKQMSDLYINVIEETGYSKEDVDYLIPHQANIRIMEAARKRLGISEDKMATTIKKYGNNSSASIPMALSEAAKRSEEHTSELQSRGHLVCRLLLEKKKTHKK